MPTWTSFVASPSKRRSMPFGRVTWPQRAVFLTAGHPPKRLFHDVAVGQNLRYLFGVGYHPTIVFFKGFWDVHRGTGVLTHCQKVVS